ncbi:MAG: hypothetical protein DRJ14_06400 [Acidobacteria bacterium]|nr:MAG: hypothetical protein DRJ14_06400 [Acidobacteriota bacterium]
MKKTIIIVLSVLAICFSSTAGDRPQLLLKKMFRSVEQNVFATGYRDKKQMAVSGNVSVTTPPSTVSRKLQMINTNLSFSFGMDGIVLPDGRCKLDFSGDMGDATIAKTSRREILYSTDFNAYAVTNKSTTSHAVNFHTYFIRKLNNIRSDFLTSGRWSFQLGHEVVYGAEKCYRITVATAFKEGTRRKARARVQNLNALITFWKRGRITFTIRKKDFMPVRIEYENPEENIHSEITFAYADKTRRPLRLDVSGNAAGVAGSGQASISYAPSGEFSAVSLQFDNALGQSVSLDLNLDFSTTADMSTLGFLPPMDAQRMAKQNLKLLMLTNIAGSLLRMQQAGINIKTIKF